MVTVLAGCSSAAPGPATQGSPLTPHTVGLDSAGHAQATLDVLTGTTLLKIGVADLGTAGSLIRVTTPVGAPAATLHISNADGTAVPGANPLIQLSASNAAEVSVVLNTRVSWQLDLAGGTSKTLADLRGGHVAGIDFTAGSDVIDLALPRPAGRVPVQLGAGASQLTLRLPGGVPARVTASGGAGEVSLEGQEHVGVAGGSVFTTPGWAPGLPGFDIHAEAGASLVAVTTWAANGEQG